MLKKEDYITIARYLYKYANCLPSIAMKRLLNVDIFRNNYTKSTIYNLLLGTRRTLKDGKRNKYFAQTIYNLILDIKENKISKELNEPNTDETTMDKQKTIETQKLSIAEAIEEIKKQKEKLKENYEKIKEEKQKLKYFITEEADKKTEQINQELKILTIAYEKAEKDLEDKEIELTATLLHQLATVTYT